ncbi:terminase large subunit [Roseomonas xinghualingensis]|uniref:terminase large subunit n=1 Tax=Roseomonas xinghualingensis TaxID=2986475 RepID=UPI0021F22DEC|nr:terminase large subunit [Roseomonas sp. SXEYE001]MCV4209888.1 terminase large subunit [Roseomonas sp. SXEYE001]
MSRPAWTTACPDWEARIVARQSLIAAPVLNPAEAEASLEVFKALKVVDLPGTPTFGEVADQWVLDFVAAIFGAVSEDGLRLIREFLLCISKKNGKSTLAAGIMLTALIRNWRLSNELLILAPTIEAAQNSFKPAADMIRHDPELYAADGGFLHIQDHIRTITHLTTKATLKVVAADGATVVGKKAAFVLIDELWEFGKKPNADAMLREATGGLVSRPEGFVISITTQADEPPAGVWKDKLTYARKVRDGVVQDPKFLPVLYEFPPAMLEAEAYLQPDNFYITNPNLGRSVSREWLEDELRKELEKGPGTRNTFLAKHLNVEIGMRLGADRWAGADLWLGAVEKGVTFEAILERCEVVVVGIDGGGADDLLGLAVLGRERETRNWLLWGRAWAQKIVLQRRKAIASELEGFQRLDELTFVDEPGPEVDEVADLVAQIDEAGILAAVGLDPMGIGEIVDALAERGISGNDRVVGVPQGWRLSGAIKTAERKLANRSLRHGGQPILAWNVGNAKVEARGNAIAIDKSAAGSAKIDVLTAAFNAIALMSRNPEAKGPSVYEERGMLLV